MPTLHRIAVIEEEPNDYLLDGILFTSAEHRVHLAAMAKWSNHPFIERHAFNPRLKMTRVHAVRFLSLLRDINDKLLFQAFAFSCGVYVKIPALFRARE